MRKCEKINKLHSQCNLNFSVHKFFWLDTHNRFIKWELWTFVIFKCDRWWLFSKDFLISILSLCLRGLDKLTYFQVKQILILQKDDEVWNSANSLHTRLILCHAKSLVSHEFNRSSIWTKTSKNNLKSKERVELFYHRWTKYKCKIDLAIFKFQAKL